MRRSVKMSKPELCEPQPAAKQMTCAELAASLQLARAELAASYQLTLTDLYRMEDTLSELSIECKDNVIKFKDMLTECKDNLARAHLMESKLSEASIQVQDKLIETHEALAELRSKSRNNTAPAPPEASLFEFCAPQSSNNRNRFKLDWQIKANIRADAKQQAKSKQRAAEAAEAKQRATEAKQPTKTRQRAREDKDNRWARPWETALAVGEFYFLPYPKQY